MPHELFSATTTRQTTHAGVPLPEGSRVVVRRSDPNGEFNGARDWMFEYFQPDFDGAEGILFVRDNQGVAFSSNDLAIVDGFFPSHKEVFGHAQEWGSFNSEDDPGVCLLNLCVQRTLRVKDEAHRGQCLAYLREQRALLVAELDSPDSTRSPEEVARLDVLYWYVACAEIMD